MTDTMEPTINKQADRAAETVSLLCSFADHLEQHPELVPYNPEADFATFASDADDFAAKVRLIGGDRRKEYPDGFDMVRVIRDFGGGVRLRLIGTRSQVCERKVVGTETVEVPDPAYIAAAPLVTETREVVEWECASVLGGVA